MEIQNTLKKTLSGLNQMKGGTQIRTGVDLIETA